MLSWNTIAKLFFFWLVGYLIQEHRKFMEKRNRRWPFRQHSKTAA